jgi:N-acetylglucosamine-6-sulfatase
MAVRTFIRCLLLLISVTLCARPATAAPRNIVFILTDDQRFDALGLLNPFFETPHLDALARDGILFENAFVTTSLCSPSRASILSGQWAHRHGVLDNNTPLDPATPTFPRALQQAGYETAFVGKWHMGGDTDQPRPGFDHWISFRGQGVYINQQFNVNGEHVNTKGHNADRVTDFAVEYLRRPHEKPFLLYVSHKAVHADFVPAERHAGSYADRSYPRPATMADTVENYAGKPAWVRAQRNSWHGVDGMYNHTVEFDDFTRRYAETLRSVDDSVGRIVATLDELGLLKSTLLVFTSDNGFQFGEHGLIDKRTMYEASIRVPLIAHCPDLFAGGQRRAQMILNTDFCPTFLEAAGLPIPDSVQGASFYPILTNAQAPGRDAFVYTYFWERDFPQTPTVIGIRTERYKLMRFQGVFDRYELYDLQNDPNETKNLVGDYFVTTQALSNDFRIRAGAPAETRDLFNQLDTRLNALLDKIGCKREPRW